MLRRRILCTLALAAAAGALIAQNTILAAPNPAQGPPATPDTPNTEATILMQHLLNETRTYRWTRTVVNLQGGPACVTAVGDPWLHYPPFVSSRTFDLLPNQANAPLQVLLFNLGDSTTCCGAVHLEVEEVADTTNAFTAVYLFGDCVTNTQEPAVQNLRLLPNPARDVFWLSEKIDFKQLKIIDLQGRVLKTFSAGAGPYPVNDLPSGAYVVLLEKEGGRAPFAALALQKVK